MNGVVGNRVVVIGAGMAGLAAAGALSEHFESVVVLERDRLQPGFGPRSGVPQGRHPHALLAGGLRALDTLFPGFQHDLAQAGAVPVRVMSELRMERPEWAAVPMPMPDLGFSVLSASRPLIEGVLRRRVETLPNVAIRADHRAAALVTSPDGQRVMGVHCEGDGNAKNTMPAELVVDASGRAALTLALLDALGVPRPEQTVIGVNIAYATAVLEMPASPPSGWKVAATFADPAGIDINGVVMPIEGARWITMIAGHGIEPQIKNWDDFLATARKLRTPTVPDALALARPPEQIQHYEFEASVWRHFERLPALPRGVLPVGDAFCRFNPVHGQGISVAAQEALLLRDLLRQTAPASDPLATVQKSFLTEASGLIATPWEMSAVNDFNFAYTRGERPANFEEIARRQSAMLAAASRDPVVLRAMTEVGHLLQPVSLLNDPAIVQRISAQANAA
jgi:2-polyprenyl-6-methoxyphenol hydroxylase-like FAD-dependent oxidoreductase